MQFCGAVNVGKSAVKFKLMPKSLDVSLEELKKLVKKKIEEMDGIFGETEELPIAFGFKALIVSLAYPEEKEIDELGNELEKIEEVSSVEMIDYRRALG